MAQADIFQINSELQAAVVQLKPFTILRPVYIGSGDNRGDGLRDTGQIVGSMQISHSITNNTTALQFSQFQSTHSDLTVSSSCPWPSLSWLFLKSSVVKEVLLVICFLGAERKNPVS